MDSALGMLTQDISKQIREKITIESGYSALDLVHTLSLILIYTTNPKPRANPLSALVSSVVNQEIHLTPVLC